MRANPENFKKKVQEVLDKYDDGTDWGDDPEMRHVELDMLMYDYLTKVGCKEGVDLIKATPRWYA